MNRQKCKRELYGRVATWLDASDLDDLNIHPGTAAEAERWESAKVEVVCALYRLSGPLVQP